MDVFQQYDNLAGLLDRKTRVINTIAGSPSAPYVKAAVTDMKAYMAAKKYRSIPIGYSAADIAELRPGLAETIWRVAMISISPLTSTA